MSRLQKVFCEEMEALVGAHIFSKERSDEEIAYLALDEVELDGDRVILYTAYWLKYLQLVINKGQARAGWSRKNRSTGVNVSFELSFSEESFSRYIVTLDVIYNGLVGKSSYLLQDDTVCVLGESVPESTIDADYGGEVCSTEYVNDSYLKNGMELMSKQIRRILQLTVDRLLSEDGYY